MKLTPPKNITLIIACVLALAGLLGALDVLVPGTWAFGLVFAGFVLLVLALFIKGL